MNVDPDYVKLLELQVDALSRAVIDIGTDLVQVGMSEYSPSHSDMIHMGAWALGLFDVLGIDPTQITKWKTDED